MNLKDRYVICIDMKKLNILFEYKLDYYNI